MVTADAVDSNQATKVNPFSGLIPSRSSLPTALLTFVVLLTLYSGWQIRNEYLLSAEFGLGYALGITGGIMMLLLLIYPLRKRFYHSSLFIFSTKNWFRLHMALGIVGPLLVLYHCNFSLGSTNSNVALGSMLLMVTSGLIGRFIYSKIHYGLYGSHAQLKELQAHKLLAQKQLNEDQNDEFLFITDQLKNQLQAFEQTVLKPRGLLERFFCIVTLGLTTRRGYFSLVRRLQKDQQQNSNFLQLPAREKHRHLKPVRRHIAAYLSTVRKIAGLSFYERLFSLWHMLHLPIFFMLIITGFIHVYAVHVY